jgi:hypothetical protein
LIVIISLENGPGAKHGWLRRPSSADQRELDSFQFSLWDAAIYMYTSPPLPEGLKMPHFESSPICPFTLPLLCVLTVLKIIRWSPELLADKINDWNVETET